MVYMLSSDYDRSSSSRLQRDDSISPGSICTCLGSNTYFSSSMFVLLGPSVFFYGVGLEFACTKDLEESIFGDRIVPFHTLEAV